MALKTTHLLTDAPAIADEFGTHNRIAALIRDEIIRSTEGRSIALVGDWGSGKSTIVELLKADFSNAYPDSTHLFIYDAWSHQGDSLRRAFLDDFIASLKSHLTEKEIAAATDQVWNRTETTTTTKEPILRRHAKMLLVSLALIPLGMKLFELPAGTGVLDGLCQPRNMLAYLFLLAPVLAVTLFGIINWTRWTSVKDFLFGDSHKENGFSVLSFFFEKIQGHAERKHIKTPVDSIRSFRDVFSQIIDNIHSHNKELRVVIIIDNIDRVPPDQARDFWSTMQTFFGDSGGLRKPQTKRYWLIAPFSVEALSFIFRDGMLPDSPATGVQFDARTKAYIDKTFGLTFYVPPPILTNWRRYLLEKLRISFPEHDESDLITVRDVFDFARSGLTITPREMKLFVNGLVALYRQRGDEISLAVMAIYILHRDKIVGTNIYDELLSSREQRLIDEADWRVPIAALHFGVSLDEATQLLLQEPIVSALREGSRDELKALEARPGFVDVFRRVMITELESPEAEDGAILAQMSVTIDGLDGARKPELSGVWRDIRSRLRTAKTWNALQSSTADGISIVLTQAHDLERTDLCQAVADSLSKADVAEPEGDFQNVNIAAANWLGAARAVVDSAGATLEPEVDFPAGNKLKLELLQQLADMDAPDKIKTAFRLDMSTDELSKALAGEIAAGRFPRTQVPLVSLLTEKMKLDLQWSVIESACVERLHVANVGAQETQSLIGLLLAARTIDGYANALNTLKTLSTQGFLSHLLQQHRKNPPAQSGVIAAIMLANPSFERPNHVEQSQNGDNAYNQLTGASSFDPSQVRGIANVIKSVRAGPLLFELGAKNSKITRLAAAVIGELTRSSYEFEVDPNVVIEQRVFLEANADINPITDFLKSLSKADETLTLLASAAFEVEWAQLYRAALGITSGEQEDPYLNFLEQGILGLDESQWVKSLNSGSNPHLELLELANDLREFRNSFELSAPARDAALDQIRKVGRGKPAPSDEGRASLAKLLQLLPDSLRKLLIRDVVDDMIGHNDAAQIVRLIEMAGDHVDLEGETDPERIVRRILGPVVSNPTERSATWIATIVERRLEFFRGAPGETKEDLGWRLRSALQKSESLTPPIVESFTTVAGLLELDISSQAEERSE